MYSTIESITIFSQFVFASHLVYDNDYENLLLH